MPAVPTGTAGFFFGTIVGPGISIAMPAQLGVSLRRGDR
jgi:hypothetical protein